MNLTALFLLSLVAPSRAGISVGNPNSNVALVEGPTTYVDEIELHRCTIGSQIVTVGESLDGDDVVAVTLHTGTFCGMDLKVQIGTTTHTIPVQGFETLQIQTTSDVTLDIEIDAASVEATLVTTP